MKRIDTINVIPFIDIMLVMLAIVLTTATFIVEGKLDIQLPEAEAVSDDQAVEKLEIGIDREGRLFLGSAEVSPEVLADRLDGIDVQTSIVLRVDADTRFAGFVSVVDLLKARKLERLTILTKNP